VGRPSHGRSSRTRSKRAPPKLACFGLEPVPLFRPVWSHFGRDFAGYVEDQNVTVELRYTQAGQQQLADHAADLVRANVDVIATFGDLSTKIAQQATSSTPIVALSDDLLGSGLISSLSRPGGNTTGITILAPELTAKRLELLSTIVPGLSRVAGLWDPTTGPSQVAMSENAARTM